MGERRDGPQRVDDLVLSPDARLVISALRERILILPGVEERVVVDDGEPCAAYYFRGRQLCHVHTERRISATVPMSTRFVVPGVLSDLSVPPEIRKAVEEAGDFGGTRWVSIALGPDAATDGLVAVLLHKIRFIERPPPRGPKTLPQDQRTLEAFR